jgi:hypothetical protein
MNPSLVAGLILSKTIDGSGTGKLVLPCETILNLPVSKALSVLIVGYTRDVTIIKSTNPEPGFGGSD